MIELTTSDGASLSAYRADPVGAPKGAVVILRDDDSMRKVADAFAAKGFVAIAPSLSDRAKPGPGSAEDPPAAHQIESGQALADIQTTIDAVKGAGKVAIVGYSGGSDLAYAAANRVSGIACVVGYSGSATVRAYQEKRKVPTLLHFGESDALIPLEAIDQFRSHRPDVSAFTYPGAAHGFDCEDSESFHEDAAQKALERTLLFISQYVEGQPPILLKNAGAYAQAKTDRKSTKKKGGADDLGPPMD
ncbi:MAG TPA: dienelactone hydrolase family protein [Bradyrhizobium sp.]|nr:dienelactone hydrolase family protein [Bradyrhizobium sp.]